MVIGLGLAAAIVGSLGFAVGGVVGLVVAALIGAAAGALLSREKPGAAIAVPSGGAVTGTVHAPPPAEVEIPKDRIDTLTGLANENGLMAWFSERIPRLAGDNRGIVVLSAYLEGLEVLTRTRGQDVVDKVLIEVAKRVAVFAGEEGIAARTGGGEFASVATVVPDHSVEVAAETAAKLAEMLQRPVELPEGVIWIGGAVGAAEGAAAEGEGVLKRARSALEKAKQIGRGHYVVDKR
jgi:diguanylate cyclase (GGDEF)-like protein